MSPKYIYHHLGLGDHIICNGLVRHYCEIYKQVHVFCKEHNYENVSYMFRDNKNITILPIKDDNEVIKFIHENKLYDDTIFVGFEKLNNYQNVRFDAGFYKSVDLPFGYRFTKFYLERDLEKEMSILRELNPDGEPFIFVHNIDKNKVRTDLKIIEYPQQYNIFDLITLIEKSTEVHLMESSIKNLVNSYRMDGPQFFYHKYVRNYPEFNNSQGLNKFNIIY